MTDFDHQPGAIHRGLGYVARWPGVALVIPNDPAHDAAVESLFAELGADPSPPAVTEAVAAKVARGELTAVAHLTSVTGATVAMAFGPMEIFVDGELLLGPGDEPTETPIIAGDRLTVRAANLSRAAEPTVPFDLRRGVVPGAGITLGGTRELAATGGVSAPPRPTQAQNAVPEPAAPAHPVRPPVPFESRLLVGAPPPIDSRPPLAIAGADRRVADEATAEKPAGDADAGRTAAQAQTLPAGGGETEIVDPGGVAVLGILCSRSHFNNPAAAFCMVCGISTVHVTHNLVSGTRPTLGFVVFDDGSTFGLDRSYVIGREPGIVDDPNTAPLTIQDNNETLSRRHAELRLIEWEVHIVDLGSTNGTFVWDLAFERWNQILPRQPVTLKPGDTVALGRRTLVYESVTRL